MRDERFVRWQGYAIAQLTFSINLFLGFAAASLCYGFSILRGDNFNLSGIYEVIFICSLVSLCISLLCGAGAVVSRLMDFRLTARKIKSEKEHTPENVAGVFKHKAKALGEATWRLFWTEIIFLSIGLLGLIFSIFAAFATNT